MTDVRPREHGDEQPLDERSHTWVCTTGTTDGERRVEHQLPRSRHLRIARMGIHLLFPHLGAIA